MNIKYIISVFKEVCYPWRYKILLMFFISISIGLLSAGYPLLVKIITDVLTSHSKSAHIIWPFVSIMLLWIVIEVFNKAHEILAIVVFTRLKVYCRLGIIRYLFQKDYDYYAKRLTGTLSTRLSFIVRSVEEIIEQIVFEYAGLIIMLLTSLVLMYSVSVMFVIFVIIWLIYHIGVTLYFLRTGARYSKTEALLYAEFKGVMIDSLRGIHTLISLHATQTEEEYLVKNHEQVTISEYNTKWHFEKMKFLQSAGALVLMLVSLRQLYNVWTYSNVPIGDVPMILILTGSILGNFWKIVETFAKLVDRLYRFQDALQYIFSGELPDLIKTFPQRPNRKITKEHLLIHHLSYSYDNEHYVFNNLNLDIQSKDKIVLYGENGIGKSTLLLLMAGFLRPIQGIVNITSEALLINSHLGLFNRSIYENILLANPLASISMIKNALSLGCCDDFISELPQGIDTILEEEGTNISSGQRQRLCIARAFVSDKNIILFDEIFSNIDERNRRDIFNNLLVNLADKILVFSEKDRYPEQKKCRLIDLGKLLISSK